MSARPPGRWQLHRQLDTRHAGAGTPAAGAPLPGSGAGAPAPPSARLDLQQDGAIDAYLVWDLLTRFARHGGAQRPSHWRVMLEFAATPAAQGMAQWCALPIAWGRSTELQAAFAPSLARAPQSAVHTAIVPEDWLPMLLDGVSHGRLLRFELGAPCSPRDPSAPALEAHATPHAGLLHTLGVIDDGCCLGHADFRRADGRTRILALWDQDPAACLGGHWARHPGAGGSLPYRYGAELSAASIDHALAAAPGLGERHERALYARLGRPDWGAPDRRHGAGVMHLLAGPRALPPGEEDAAKMPVVFVQLPAATVADTAGDSLGMHVVDGARYIVDRTRAAASDDNGWRSTIAISMGSIAGPHDGSSMAELALDQLAADVRVQLVVAAGNCAQARLHAQHVVHQDSPAVWWLRLPPDKQRDTFVQVWLPADQPVERFQLQVSGPGLEASPLLRVGHAATLARADRHDRADRTDPSDELPLAAVVWTPRPAQGLRGSMMLLALAPTARRRGDPERPLAPPGLWRIEVQAAGPVRCDVHAWVERDDLLIGPRRPQQARFETTSKPTAAGDITPSHSLGSLANGFRCTIASGHVANTLRVSAMASQGPRRGEAGPGGSTLAPPHGSAHGHHGAGPQTWAHLCFAPIDASPSLRGVPVPGFFSGQRSRLGGTSAAAPQVARWLAEGRLTDEASRWLAPALPSGLPLPPQARCIPPESPG